MIGLVVVLVITASEFARAGPTIPETDDVDGIVVPEFPPPSTSISQSATAKQPIGGSPKATVLQICTGQPIVHPPLISRSTAPSSKPARKTRPTATSTTTTTTMSTTTTTTPPVKLIICTVGERATSEAMYPPDKYCDYLFYTNVFMSTLEILPTKDNVSWAIFQEMGEKYKVMELGISFDLLQATLYGIVYGADAFNKLRFKGIKHYGLLTVVPSQPSFFSTVQLTEAVLAALKERQGKDHTAKTVLALGSYPVGSYNSNGYFIADYVRAFIHAAETFTADIVITIISSGWTGSMGSCFAAPPNVYGRHMRNYTDIKESWFFVSYMYNYTNPLVITGMGFEIATLQYVMEETPTSLSGSVFSPCLSVKKTGLQALCGEGNFSRSAEFYLGNGSYTYGHVSNRTGVLTLSEYYDTLALKFRKAVAAYNGFRDRTAWLLFNVHNEDLNNQCPDPPFSVIKMFCKELKGPREQRCQ